MVMAMRMVGNIMVKPLRISTSIIVRSCSIAHRQGVSRTMLRSVVSVVLTVVVRAVVLRQ
jgi:hypothetical protein